MDNGEVQLVGPSCGQHGPYTFFKAFKYAKHGLQRTVKLSEFFFVKLWSDSDLVCIGELQLLWVDKNSEQVLSSLRLYFLPENTPEGRMDHGEDEVLAISEKVVLRLEDLITWITVDAEWTWGRLAKCDSEVKEEPKITIATETNILQTNNRIEGPLDIMKIEKEKLACDDRNVTAKPSVMILSYPRYCRYRAVMKRLEGVEDEYLKHTIVKLLGGFTVPNKNTRILFCRETFDYPELEGHELLCNHLAPKLKGRPRGRRKKRSLSPGSESNESESSISNVFNSAKNKIMTEGSSNGFRPECGISTRRSTRSSIGNNNESKEFMVKLSAFMKTNRTPIGRIPCLGYKELDLYSFFTKVDKLGGYNAVTSNRLWKSIFDDLSGNYISTSAATVIRRHYEKFLLPYERHFKGEEYKPTSSIKRVKCISGSGSDADTSESTSTSGKSSPIPQLVPIDPTVVESTHTDLDPCSLSLDSCEKVKPEQKTSALRSIRLKSERLKDNSIKEKAPENTVALSDNAQSYNTENNNMIANDYVVISPKMEIRTNDPTNEVNNRSVLKVEEISGEENSITNGGLSCHHQTSSLSLSIPAILPKLIEETNQDEEVKENIATSCNTNNNNILTVNNYKTSEVDLTEVPYKPKSVAVASETSLLRSPSSENSGISGSDVVGNVVDTNLGAYHGSVVLNSFKRRKLDILKEGGLEVTPIKPCHELKDERPSVIQQHQPSATISTTVGQISITVKPENVTMPPQINGNSRQHMHQMSSVSSFKPHTPVKSCSTNYSHLNGQSPPIQSRSIYSYSEKTVYGNPRDYVMLPPPCPPPQVPKIVDLTKSILSGGEILDLTVKSPSKPINDIMRVPMGAASRSFSIPLLKESYQQREHITSYHRRGDMGGKNSVVTGSSTPTLPSILDARVSSNLQITLVDSHGRPSPNGAQTSRKATTAKLPASYLSPNNRPISPYIVGNNHQSSINNFSTAKSTGVQLSSNKRPSTLSSFSTVRKENGRVSASNTLLSSSYTNYHHHHSPNLPPQPPQHSPYLHHHQQQQQQQHPHQSEHQRIDPKTQQQIQQHQQVVSHHHHPKLERPSPKTSSSNNIKHPVPPVSNPTSAPPPVLPPEYYSQLSMASKMMNSSYGPPIDPIYYSALQNLYPHAVTPSSIPPSPYFSIHHMPPDQLQFYSDLMAMRFSPYQYPPHESPGVAPPATLSNGKVETNSYKKQ